MKLTAKKTKPDKKKSGGKLQSKQLYLMLIPALTLMIMFNYMPMVGLVLAFKKINYRQNIFLSPWNGLDNFKFMLHSPEMLEAIRNTLLYNIVFIFVGMIMAIALALLLDLVVGKKRKKLYQTVMIMPHFLSWVIISYIVYAFLSMGSGYINNSILPAMGIDPINWYNEAKYWPVILIICYFWKDWGYSSVIYSAALSGVDTSLYEAADVDGASIWQKLINITLPSIKPLIVTMFILKLGSVLSTDMGLFYQVPLNQPELYSTTNVLSTYTYNMMMGSSAGSMGMASATSFIQSVVGFLMVIGANKLVKLLDKESDGIM